MCLEVWVAREILPKISTAQNLRLYDQVRVLVSICGVGLTLAELVYMVVARMGFLPGGNWDVHSKGVRTGDRALASFSGLQRFRVLLMHKA